MIQRRLQDSVGDLSHEPLGLLVREVEAQEVAEQLVVQAHLDNAVAPAVFEEAVLLALLERLDYAILDLLRLVLIVYQILMDCHRDFVAFIKLICQLLEFRREYSAGYARFDK